MPVAIELRSRRLAPKQRHRVVEVLESVAPELFGRAVFRVVRLGLGRHDLVEERALAVLGARFEVRLRHRDRLAEHPPPFRPPVISDRSRDHGGAMMCRAAGAPRRRYEFPWSK